MAEKNNGVWINTAGVAAVFLSSPVSASAMTSNADDSCPGGTCTVELTPEQMFDLVQQELDRGNVSLALDILTTLSRNPNIDFRSEARVRIARILQARGDLNGALYWYDQLLDEKPDAASVRIELARLLALMGKEQAAAGELRRAEAAGLPPEVARSVRNAANAFRSNARFDGSLSFGLAPDTNINSATSDNTVTLFGLPFELNPEGRKKSGLGLTLGAQATIRHPVNDNARMTIEFAASGKIYRQSSFNDIIFSSTIGPEIGIRAFRFRPALLLGRRYFGIGKLYDFYGISTTTQYALGGRAVLVVGGALTQFNYVPIYARQTGLAYNASIGYERALSSRFAARVAIGFNRAEARDPAVASTGPTMEVVLSRDIGHFTAIAHETYRRTWADARYGFFGVTRQDHVVGEELGLLFRKLTLFGMNPQISVEYTRSFSNISLFDYSRLRGDFTLSKRF